jgi:DNA-binding LacI/PurR family transcriptional regulator
VVDPSDSYTVEASRTFAKDEPAFWLCTDNRAAGHAMGAHLRARGHRRIAFISQLPPPRHRWIECRLAGLSDFFAEIDGGMTVFTRERPRESLLGEERAMLSEIKRLRRFYAGRKGLPAAVTATVTGDLFSLNSMLSAAVEAEPLFEAALARKDITAWVCCNDDLALIAREYLFGAGVRPGRDIALAGFDNTLHARASDITSYDFALRTLGYAAVQCLVRPHFFPPAARGVKRIQGGLVGRGSTGGSDQKNPKTSTREEARCRFDNAYIMFPIPYEKRLSDDIGYRLLHRIRSNVPRLLAAGGGVCLRRTEDKNGQRHRQSARRPPDQGTQGQVRNGDHRPAARRR